MNAQAGNRMRHGRFLKGLSAAAFLFLIGCGYQTHSVTDQIAIPVVSDTSGIMFYRLRTEGVAKYRDGHSPGDYAPESIKYDIVRYDFANQEARIVEKIDGMTWRGNNKSPALNLKLSYQKNKLSENYQITPADCYSYQLTSGTPAYQCGSAESGSRYFGVLESLNSSKIIEFPTKPYEAEAVLKGNVPHAMFSSPKLEIFPGHNRVVLYGTNPVGGTYGDKKEWKYLVQTINQKNQETRFDEVTVDARTEISRVGIDGEKLLLLIAPAFLSDMNTYTVIELSNSGAQNIISRFKYGKPGVWLFNYAFIPERNEIYFMSVDNNRIVFVQYNYIEKTTKIIPVLDK